MRIFFVFAFPFLGYANLLAQHDRLTREMYIEKYKDAAINEMNRAGIPASITLAQGILESDNGNSILARKANNHFGIKCHDWTGKSMNMDDDEKNECFRKYKSVDESFKDHSEFLRNSSRYKSLFILDRMDYKGWAKGLKKAGYATSKSYANDLITIIDESNLHQYDIAMVPKLTWKQKREKAKQEARLKAIEEARKKNNPADSTIEIPELPAEFTVDIVRHPVYIRNHKDFIMVKPGDTYNQLTKELNLLPWELAMFNEIDKTKPLLVGTELYLQPKRNQAARGYDIHIVQQGETMFTIAQKYCIKLKFLYKKNCLTEGSEPIVGQKLNLRKALKCK
jgi:LysM repeat protein